MAIKFGSEGSGILWCHPGGTNCLTTMVADENGGARQYFSHPKEGEEYYDRELSRLATDINELVATTERREKESGKRDASLEIGFLRTSNGYLPVWKRNVSESERLEDLVDVSSLKPLGTMSDEDVKSYLQIESNFGGDGEWFRHTGGGVYRCKGAGMSCYVTAASRDGFKTIKDSNYFPKVEPSSPVYDPALSDLADKLNAALNATQKANRPNLPEPQPEIGLAIEEEGIAVVWKIVERD